MTRPDTSLHSEVCLYRCWTWDVNGKPSKAQACYPGAKLSNVTEADIGKTITEPLRSNDGKFHKMQVIRCKYPECI